MREQQRISRDGFNEFISSHFLDELKYPFVSTEREKSPSHPSTRDLMVIRMVLNVELSKFGVNLITLMNASVYYHKQTDTGLRRRNL